MVLAARGVWMAFSSVLPNEKPIEMCCVGNHTDMGDIHWLGIAELIPWHNKELNDYERQKTKL